MFFDVHHHVVKDVEDMLDEDYQYCAVQTTNESEWDCIVGLKHPRILKGIGHHPWWVAYRTLNEHNVEAIVDEFDFVGEIGIDKVAIDPMTKKPYDFQEQCRVFEWMFKTACRHRKAVSIHCVGAYGYLFDYLASLQCRWSRLSNKKKKETPLASWNHTKCAFICQESLKIPHIMLHSYSGSLEMIKRFLSLSFGDNIYFSVSQVVNGRSPKALQSFFHAIPINKWLLESDLSHPDRVVEAMHTIAVTVSILLGKSLRDTKTIAIENAKKFYNIS